MDRIGADAKLKIPHTLAIKVMNNSSPKNELKPSANINSDPKVEDNMKEPINAEPIAVDPPIKKEGRSFFALYSIFNAGCKRGYLHFDKSIYF